MQRISRAVCLLGILAIVATSAVALEEKTLPTILISGNEIAGLPPTTFPVGTFYNPNGIRVGDELFMYVQGGMGLDPADSPWQWCWGDEIVLFKAPWTYEGLRSSPLWDSRISPCTCLTPSCSDADKFHYGLGSVQQSAHDSNFYMFLDKSDQGASFPGGDFKEILLGMSTDGEAWQFPSTFNPFILQSEVCAPSCQTISIIDVTMKAEQDYWWGFFKFGTASPSQIGRIRVEPDATHPRGFRVSFLSGGVYLEIANDGSFDFMPDNVGSPSGVNQIVTIGGSTELWADRVLSPDDAFLGCDDSTNRGSTITRRVATEDLLEDISFVPSSSRPSPSRNSTGRKFPFLVEDDAGYTVMFSSSSDQVCENVASWPPGGNTFVGMDIVGSVLSDDDVKDTFSYFGTARQLGSTIDGTNTEIGSFTWTASSSLTLLDETVVVDTAVGSASASFPVGASGLADTMVRIEALVYPSTGWQSVGFSSSAGGHFGVGTLWVRLDSAGAVRLSDDTNVLATASIGAVTAPQTLTLLYDPLVGVASVAVASAEVLSNIAVPGAPDLSFIGFTMLGPTVNDSSIDSFSVGQPAFALFADGFESGNTSNWSETVD